MPDVPVEQDPVVLYLNAAQNRTREAKATNTLDAYESDWRAFQIFCAGRDVSSLPAAPGTVALFAAESARTLKADTIARRVAAIRWAHRRAGFLSPTDDRLVRDVLRGIRHLKGTAQRAKQPLSLAMLRKMVAAAPDDLRGRRDRALLVVGCAGRLRSWELLSLRHEDVWFTDEGLLVTIPKSKTDHNGGGQTVKIAYGPHPDACPVRVLAAWLERSHISSGYLFPALGRWGREVSAKPISSQQLAKVIKRLGAGAGFNPEALSPKSLQSGSAYTESVAEQNSRAKVSTMPAHRSLPRALVISALPPYCSPTRKRPVGVPAKVTRIKNPSAE